MALHNDVMLERGQLDLGPDIDSTIFGQILEVDREDERDFSKSIVYEFFEQAEKCFADMQVALENEDLLKLSWLGSFLRDSSAQLGLTKVKDSCAKIQHFGKKRNEDNSSDKPDEKGCLAAIKTTLEDVKVEHTEVEIILKKFFRDEPLANEWRALN